MPCWARIPPDRLVDIRLFGYELISGNGSTSWFLGPYGRMSVEINNPRVLFEDASEAHQCGASSIFLIDEDEI
jgi:hypothetical protein